MNAVITSIEDSRQFIEKEENLLTATWSVPYIAPTNNKKAVQRLNRYYQTVRTFLAHYTEGTLLNLARRQFAFYRKFEFPFIPHTMASNFTITYRQGNLLSLYKDRYEYAGGANGFTFRMADTWDLTTGFPLSINLKKCRHKLLAKIEAQALAGQNAGTATYFDPLHRNLRTFWVPEQWYLTPEGLAIFYQEATISPHVSGTPVFVLSFDEIRDIKALKPLLLFFPPETVEV